MVNKKKWLESLNEQMSAAELLWRNLDEKWKAEKDEVKQLQLQLQQKAQLLLLYQLSAERMFLCYCDK